MIVFSVIVCTRNREDLLEANLRSLVAQTIDPGFYEIWVVDNGSTDRTAEIARRFESAHANFHYTFEQTVGLSSARNRGLQVANGLYVAYIDDDCRAPERWIETGLDIVNTHAPDVFGGPYFACYDGEKPRWFRGEYASRTYGAELRLLMVEEHLPGGNVFLRADLVRAVGGFDTQLGMKGEQVAYGEDNDLQRRVRVAQPGARFLYDPRLFIHALVRADKMTIGWRMRSAFGKGFCYNRWIGRVADPPGKLRLAGSAIKAVSAGILDLGMRVLVRDRRRYPYSANYWWEHSAQYARTLGLVCAQWRR